MNFEIVFVENENPKRDSSGGIMTYLLGLNEFLKLNSIKTTLIGVGKKQKIGRASCRERV